MRCITVLLWVLRILFVSDQEIKHLQISRPRHQYNVQKYSYNMLSLMICELIHCGFFSLFYFFLFSVAFQFLLQSNEILCWFERKKNWPLTFVVLLLLPPFIWLLVVTGDHIVTDILTRVVCCGTFRQSANSRLVFNGVKCSMTVFLIMSVNIAGCMDANDAFIQCLSSAYQNFQKGLTTFYSWSLFAWINWPLFWNPTRQRRANHPPLPWPGSPPRR